MPSWQSYFIRPMLYAQKYTQRWATIASTRQMFRSSEKPGGLPTGLRLETITVGETQCEWYIPDRPDSDRVIVYFHGGGNVFPLWTPMRKVMYYLAHISHVRVFAINFRLAPEHPFPAAIDDCSAAYRWLISDGGVAPQNVSFIGESGGAVLVLTTALALRNAGTPLPGKLVSVNGSFDVVGALERFKNVDDPMVYGPFALMHIHAYIGSADPRDPLISPAYADLTGLPPLYIQVGEEELDCDDVREFAKIAAEAGVPVKLDIWPRMWHYWHVFVPFLPEAREALATVRDFILA